MTADTVAQAFLFDADALGVSDFYGGDFEPKFLGALSTVDHRGITRSTLMLGDVLISTLCTRVIRVSAEPRSSSHTEAHDMELYKTIVWDLTDALSHQHHSLDIERLPGFLANRNIYCITAATLPEEFVGPLDVLLRKANGYLGGFEVDLANPIQKRLFIDYLVDVAVVTDGRIVLELSLEGTAETRFEGSGEFKPFGEKRVPAGELDSLKPPLPLPASYSVRGQLSADRYRGKRTFTIHDRVLTAMSHARSYTGRDFSFAFDALHNQSGQILEAELPENKFVHYLLNPTHEKGRTKAKFFMEVLGIGPGDWRYLAGQFYAGVKRIGFDELKIKAWNNDYGISFNCNIPVRGLNGQVAMVETNWIVRPGMRPQLTTAVPAKHDAEAKVDESDILALPNRLTGDARWFAIYQRAKLAGEDAAAACVPTPMKILGGELMMEGACGYANVRLSDARKRFARWAIKHGVAKSYRRFGASIHVAVGSQSYDRAVAYAKSFAAVLQLNGIQCSVEARYD